MTLMTLKPGRRGLVSLVPPRDRAVKRHTCMV